ncbi:MAG TPA: hypothetical protein VHX38_23150 [Pseudonocardiaceae bacterium]|nr:hypothetical protein [Pseudonocardiaceae bacterium]
MTSSGGYQVDPNELHTFASYLGTTTHSEVTDAANGVKSANGFDDNAFGIFAAQLLAVPARIAMAVAVDNLNSLAKEVSDAAQSTTTTATNYQRNDQNSASSFQSINGTGTS